MAKSRLVLATLVVQAAAAQVQILQSEACSNLPRCLGELPTILEPGKPDILIKTPPLVIGNKL